MGQSELGEYADGDRPVNAEAQAVAGGDADGNSGNTGQRIRSGPDDRFESVTETVDVAVMQVDYTVEGSGDEEYPVVHIFGRTADRELVHARILEFRPYFYAPSDKVTDQRLAEYDRITGAEETDADGEPYESIRGERLTKIFGQTPRDVGRIRDDFDHYEADILFPNRLLIDKDVTSGVRLPDRPAGDDPDDEGVRRLRVHHEEINPIEMDVTPRVNTFDIEVDDRSGFPEDGEEPIICITGHDSYRDEYVLWLYEAPDGDGTIPDALPGYEPIAADRLDVEVRSFTSEAAMLDDFLGYFETHDADIATGWNFTDFDAPYLLDRLDVLNSGVEQDLDPDRFSRVREVWRSDWQGPSVKGRVMFDLLYAYQRTKFTELDSYRLEDVGQRELGVGKERYSGDIGDLWEDDPEQLLEYNLRDVELCVELDRDQAIIPFWNEVRQFVGCKIEDATTPGDAVDMYVLHKLHDEYVLPSKGQQESEDYEGGAVFDPITGVRENVSVLDLKSLYPMCMVTTNASPETKVDPETYDGDTYVAPNGTHFRKEPDGVIREMVDELLTEREEKKTLRNEYDPNEDDYEQYDRQQQAVKVIMNCFTPDTEVLTPAGVQGIQELEVGDEVYSLNPETMLMETKQVTETHAYPHYRGELVDIETSKIDFSVTPNHRMLVRKNDANGITEEEWDFVEAKELYDYCHYEMPHDWGFDHGSRLEGVDLTEWLDSEYEVWVCPEIHGRAFTSELGWQPPTILKNDIGVEGYVFTAEEFNQHREYIESVCEESFVHAEPNRKWIPRTYDGDDFLELLAWYITEGNVYTSEPKEFGENYRGSSTTIQLAQDETVLANGGESNHDRIGRLLDRMGFDYYVDGHSYQFTSELLGTFLRKECGEGSFEKRIPDVVFNVSEEQKRSFLETLIEGDGDWQTNSWRYTTSSEQLRDDVLQLCTHLGLTVNYGQNGGSWRIYCDEESKNSFRMHRDGSENTADDGVYCVTVEDNNTILAGRDGKFQNVGQSLYGVLGWDRFRLYDREMGAAVTATGREVIEFTEEVTNELEKEVIYGDSVTGDRPVVVRDPSGDVRVAPIEKLFERAHDGGSARLERTDEGDIVETDPKEYRLLPGWEALSLSTDGEPQWQPIERVIRHETSKDVLTLQHELGESTTTTDHAYVVDDGEYRVARPTEVDEPVRVPSLPPVDQKETVDVSGLLEGCTQANEDGRGGGDVPGDTITKHEKVHADDEHVWVGREHHGDRDGTPKLKRFVDPQGEDGHALIRLVAAYIAKGSVSTTERTDTRHGARISAEHRERLERLRADYERLFSSVTASIVESDSSERPVEYGTEDGGATLVSESKTHEIQLTDELAAVFFREVAGQTSRGKRVPSFVFHLPETEQALFLETLTGGDDAREFQQNSEEHAGQDFEFETTSRELAAGVAMLLIQCGETYSLTYRQENSSYTVQTCDSHRQERARVYSEEDHDGYVYDLSVAENENFVDGVGGIVLHNTDSVMVSVGTDISKADAIDQSFELEERINESYDEFAREQLNAAEHRFQIEFEKLYRRFFQAGKKKRYSGHIIWKEGKDVDDIDITGFEHQRSDVAPITKEVQQRVLEMVVTGEGTEAVKSYVHEVIEEFLDGEVDLEEIGIPGGIGKRLDNYATDTAQVRGAKYANLLLGTNFGRGSKPKRVYLDRVHSDFFERVEAELGLDPAEDPLYGEFRQDPDVICFEYADQLPEEFEIDWEKMLEKTLKGPIARILEALDISWEEVRTGQEQTGLGNFM